MSKLVIIDAMAILHRAYHALPKFMKTRDGEPINAVYGFVSMLLRIIDDLEPTHIAVCYDRPEPTFRKKEFEDYQSHRPEVEKELSTQFEKSKDVIDAMDISRFEKKGFEADDVIGTIAKAAEKKVGEVIIITGDKDQFQLVNDKVKLYVPVTGLSKAKMFGEHEVEEKMGVKPGQIVDYKALMGDPSDNYKGVNGIGPKTASNLLAEYKTLESIYDHIEEIPGNTKKKLEEGRESAFQSQKLAQIITNVDINFDLEKTNKWNIGGERVIELFKSYGFKTLTKRIEEYLPADATRQALQAGGFRTLRKRVQSFKNSKTQKLQTNSKSKVKNYKKNLTKEEVGKVVVKIAKRLKGKRYAIRGTASMILQGLDMGVDDIDIIADGKTSMSVNKIFSGELVNKIEYSESDKFRSYFGSFAIDLSAGSGQAIYCEVAGDFQVKTKNGWTEKQDASDDEVTEIEINGTKVKVTKLDLELKTSADMGRWNEFHKIKKQIAEKNQQSLF